MLKAYATVEAQLIPMILLFKANIQAHLYQYSIYIMSIYVYSIYSVFIVSIQYIG